MPLMTKCNLLAVSVFVLASCNCYFQNRKNNICKQIFLSSILMSLNGFYYWALLTAGFLAFEMSLLTSESSIKHMYRRYGNYWQLCFSLKLQNTIFCNVNARFPKWIKTKMFVRRKRICTENDNVQVENIQKCTNSASYSSSTGVPLPSHRTYTDKRREKGTNP